MTADEFREMALGMPGAVEGAHMGHPDFRANGRIFATLDATGELGMVKLAPDEQGEAMRTWSRVFTRAAGAWGRQGCTMVRLSAASTRAVRGPMQLAWQGVMALPATRAARARSAAKAPSSKRTASSAKPTLARGRR